jgi:acetolactate synthase-1/2/3 large subunit
MSRDLARRLAAGLKAAGVTRLFGVPGGGPNLDMIGSAEELGIDFVLAHGETAACVMASTYGRLTGSVGVAVVTRGPGFTSACNGLAQATLDRYPLLLVSDTVPGSARDRIAHQRVDQVSASAPLAKWSGVLGTRDPESVVRACVSLATRAPAGAVHLDFDPTCEGDDAPVVPARSPVDPDLLARARALVCSARRPLVIVGLDAVHAVDSVRAALAQLGVPVLVTYEAVGVVPASWPGYAGLFTGVAADRPILERADLVIGIGLDPVEPMPGPEPAVCPVVLLHSHALSAAYFGDPLVVVGEYADLLPEVLGACEHEWVPGTGRGWHRDRVEWLSSSSSVLTPQDVVAVTHDVMPDAIATVDAGAHMLAVMTLWATDEPDSVLISNGLATMGFALPAAIGAALARPERRVVCFVGDGGLGMVLSELELLARLDLDITVVVFNDATLSLIRLKQAEGQGGRAAVGYGQVDFATVAEAMGVTGTAVSDVDGLRAALSLGVGHPRLVDARIDPDSYAHVMAAVRG